jgi:hypothetical protein
MGNPTGRRTAAKCMIWVPATRLNTAVRNGFEGHRLVELLYCSPKESKITKYRRWGISYQELVGWLDFISPGGTKPKGPWHALNTYNSDRFYSGIGSPEPDALALTLGSDPEPDALPICPTSLPPTPRRRPIATHHDPSDLDALQP